MLLGLISIICLLASAALFCRLMKAGRVVDIVVFFFLFLTGEVIVIGFVLSALTVLGSLPGWTLGSSVVFLLTALIAAATGRLRGILSVGKAVSRIADSLKTWFEGLSRFEKVSLGLLLGAVFLVGVLNLVAVIWIAPGTYDSMTYHLPRVAYYLQQGSLRYFDANESAQVIRPYNSAILKLYTFVVTGKNENLSQLVQFIAYWVAIATVYGLSREIGLKRAAGFFSALVFALLTECLMQATTAQNDMLIAAYAGCFVYSLFAFKNRGERRYLFMSGASFGLAAGVKGTTFLLVPSLLLITGYVFYRRLRSDSGLRAAARNGILLLLFFLLGLAVFALPAGYLDNYLRFGHPLGPEKERTVDSYEGKPFSFIIEHGAKNVLRYGLDFLSLDGLPPAPPVVKSQELIRFLPKAVLDSVGIELETSVAVTEPWRYDRKPYTHEESSTWGALGFALVWPVLFLFYIGILKSPDCRVFAIAAFIFVLLLAFSGGYGYAGGGGRWSVYIAVFACPPVGFLFPGKSRVLRAYLLGVIVIGCLSGLTATFFRYNYDGTFVSRGALLFADRLSQLTVTRGRWRENCRRFEQFVPKTATVAVCLNPNSFEYPLFGERLTRKIIPINSFRKGVQPVPEEADFLLFTNDFPDTFDPKEAQVYLGWDWYLKKLPGKRKATLGGGRK